MNGSFFQLRRIEFSGPKQQAGVDFTSGVNVICGASDTGKSFLAESINFMLGGSELREIEQRAKYGKISLSIEFSDGDECRLDRSTSGGSFLKTAPGDDDSTTLKQSHAHNKADNLSGFLLSKLDLLGRRILRSKAKGTTQSLSFRNLARLVIVQEGEIQQRGSPFWGGQFTLKTSEMATVKLLLTGVDDTAVVSVEDKGADDPRVLAMVEEMLSDLKTEIEDLGLDKEELVDQFSRLGRTIDSYEESLDEAQKNLDERLSERRKVFQQRQDTQERVDDILNLLARFDLLSSHYVVDIERLQAIEESGSMFVHVHAVPCPLCGALPEDQHKDEACEGDTDAVVAAASAEIEKIRHLQRELDVTVSDLKLELKQRQFQVAYLDADYESIEGEIQGTLAPEVQDVRTSFSRIVQKKAEVNRAIDLFDRLEKLEERKVALENDEGETSEREEIKTGLPDSVAHEISVRISEVLKAWNFPGECLVHFDKEDNDFVIDGKPRGSRGKGLRAITHAAVTIALLEHCQENQLPHPGFVVMDSPLLAYFKPEEDEDAQLKGSDLKERFYEYLIAHHKSDSQIIIVENQHPPESVQDDIKMTVFTGNPNEGRFGFL